MSGKLLVDLCWSLPEARASIMYPLTGAAPMSPSDQWMVSAEDVLVMDISIGDPGEPVVSERATHILVSFT